MKKTKHVPTPRGFRPLTLKDKYQPGDVGRMSNGDLLPVSSKMHGQPHGKAELGRGWFRRLETAADLAAQREAAHNLPWKVTPCPTPGAVRSWRTVEGIAPDRSPVEIGGAHEWDAAFIVRACNSHAALVAALESAAAELNAIPFIHRHDGINKPLETLRAALKAATA